MTLLSLFVWLWFDRTTVHAVLWRCPWTKGAALPAFKESKAGRVPKEVQGTRTAGENARPGEYFCARRASDFRWHRRAGKLLSNLTRCGEKWISSPNNEADCLSQVDPRSYYHTFQVLECYQRNLRLYGRQQQLPPGQLYEDTE